MSKFLDSINQDFEEEFGNDYFHIPSSESISSLDRSNLGRLTKEEAMKIVDRMKSDHESDLKRIEMLKKENKKLKLEIAIYEKTNEHADSVSKAIDNLTDKYIKSEQLRTQQNAEIQQLIQEIEYLKSVVAKS